MSCEDRPWKRSASSSSWVGSKDRFGLSLTKYLGGGSLLSLDLRIPLSISIGEIDDTDRRPSSSISVLKPMLLIVLCLLLHCFQLVERPSITTGSSNPR